MGDKKYTIEEIRAMLDSFVKDLRGEIPEDEFEKSQFFMGMEYGAGAMVELIDGGIEKSRVYIVEKAGQYILNRTLERLSSELKKKTKTERANG